MVKEASDIWSRVGFEPEERCAGRSFGNLARSSINRRGESERRQAVRASRPFRKLIPPSGAALRSWAAPNDATPDLLNETESGRRSAGLNGDFGCWLATRIGTFARASDTSSTTYQGLLGLA